MGKTGEILEYRHLITGTKYKEVWVKSFWKEIRRLAMGIPDKAEGTDIMHFIHKEQVPPERRKDVTRDQVVCTVHPEKDDLNRTRICPMRNLINHPGENGMPTADLLMVKNYLTAWCLQLDQNSRQLTSRISTSIFYWTDQST